MKNDIVIIKLTTPLKFNGNVGPACLPPAEFEFFENEKANTSGWGLVYNNGMGETYSTTKLNYVDAPILTNAQCLDSKWKSRGEIFPSQICAGYTDGTYKDSCQGDSGGPLVVQKYKDQPDAIIVGVVSFGPAGCAMYGYPGFYARVTNFVDWIVTNMG